MVCEGNVFAGWVPRQDDRKAWGCCEDHSVATNQMVFGTKERGGRESLEM